MRNVILGAIGVVWGGAIIVSGLVRGVPAGEGAYGGGQLAGFIFGFVLLTVGAWGLYKSVRARG